ncbi:fibrous sheath CABYR-binding protein-like [Copidosoma floridanum]|uniref:fibrous sheath CABYR-binding protein-like n=1 Tax=Copidosoma floridanum TaxID=29053 RepID=UPI000C6F8AAD|nr:fibrous sheath CABYR-binding protein-like [Copidosoma floridanum]
MLIENAEDQLNGNEDAVEGAANEDSADANPGTGAEAQEEEAPPAEDGSAETEAEKDEEAQVETDDNNNEEPRAPEIEEAPGDKDAEVTPAPDIEEGETAAPDPKDAVTLAGSKGNKDEDGEEEGPSTADSGVGEAANDEVRVERRA